MFTVTGQLDERREASISWHAPGDRCGLRGLGFDRGLVGDDELARRAIIDEIEGRTFRATPTGPFYLANLDNPEAALVQLTSYFRPRYRVDGDPPKIDASVPDGAVA